MRLPNVEIYIRMMDMKNFMAKKPVNVYTLPKEGLAKLIVKPSKVEFIINNSLLFIKRK